MATTANPTSNPDDPGLFSWVLAVLLWAECIVAVVAALRSAVAIHVAFFVLYAMGLALAAVARSGPVTWMRPVSWAALVAVAAVHASGWALSLGREPPGRVELLLYAAGLVGCALLMVREAAPSRDDTLDGWARTSEVVARAVGLGFLAGVLLLFVDAVVRLPFSGH